MKAGKQERRKRGKDSGKEKKEKEKEGRKGSERANVKMLCLSCGFPP
jgi:hypothetical protein